MDKEELKHRRRGNEGPPPGSDLDLYDKVVDPEISEEFLRDNNLGTGNYSEGELWQQVESYGQGIFADAAFAGKLLERRIEETKRTLAREGAKVLTEDVALTVTGWEDLSDEEKEELDEELQDRRRYIQEKKEELWSELDTDEKVTLVEEISGVPDWMPPQLRMTLMRHEVSKSKGARTQDNLFGRVKEFQGDVKEAAQGALGGLGGK